MQEHLELEEKAANNEVWWHIHRIRKLLGICVRELLERAEEHDQTKLDSPEVEIFTEHTPKLAALTFGTEDYEESKRLIDTALSHHYARNRHHPEFHKDGVDDMSLLDVLEMLCDWMAASERQHNGNIRKSLEAATRKYRISPQLARIMENTVRVLE